MPHTAWPVRLRMLFTGENAAVDGHFQTPSEATTIPPGGAGATRAVTGADTRGATNIAAGDAASVVTGASTIAAASLGTGTAVGVEGAVFNRKRRWRCHWLSLLSRKRSGMHSRLNAPCPVDRTRLDLTAGHIHSLSFIHGGTWQFHRNVSGTVCVAVAMAAAAPVAAIAVN
jgi:hypothetical protein